MVRSSPKSLEMLALLELDFFESIDEAVENAEVTDVLREVLISGLESVVELEKSESVDEGRGEGSAMRIFDVGLVFVEEAPVLVTSDMNNLEHCVCASVETGWPSIKRAPRCSFGTCPKREPRTVECGCAPTDDVTTSD